MEGSTFALVGVAVERVAELTGDEAKAAALKALVHSINELDSPDERIAAAFERIFSIAAGLEQRWSRVRVLADVCENVVVSRLPREQRGALLEGALEATHKTSDPAERIDQRITVIEALIDLRWSDVDEHFDELAKTAAALEDEKDRVRATTQVALTMAKRGDGERARVELETLGASPRRARALARLAHTLLRDRLDVEWSQAGDTAPDGATLDAAALCTRALDDLEAAPDSFDRSHSLRSVLATLVETDAGGAALFERGVKLAESLNDGRFRKDALLGAIRALAPVSPNDERVADRIERLEASIERIEEVDFRAELLGQLALSVATHTDVQACARLLEKTLAIAGTTKAVDLVNPVGDLPSAIPIPEILATLADAGASAYSLQWFAHTSLELLSRVDDPASLGAILAKMTRFFASPALHFSTRVALLQRSLDVARTIDDPDERTRAAVRIANGFSMAGASERGDAMFDGIASVIGEREIRAARQARAIVLTRLGRTADAKAEIDAVTATTKDEAWHAIEELAQTSARCGMLADMLASLARVHPSRQQKARAQSADALAESTYLDPYIRELGLVELGEKAEEPAKSAILCLLAQVRILEGLGEPREVLEAAFRRVEESSDQGSAAILAQQLVNALIERISRMR